MLLIVATRSRPKKQLTLDALDAAGLLNQTVVVGTGPEDKPVNWRGEFLTSGTNNLTDKRNWILDHFGPREKMVVFDDDLRFSTLNLETGKYAKSTPEQFRYGLERVWEILDRYPLVGCLPKFIARGIPPSEVQVNGKVFHMLATNFSLVKGDCPRWDGIVHQDTEMNIQLLYRGYNPALYTHMAHDDIPGKPGGCSIYRDAKMEARVTMDLIRKYPGFVTMTDLGAERVAWAKLKMRCLDVQLERGEVQ